MSGVLPETERERQLRQLAGRLLTPLDPRGPVTTDLMPVGYPGDLPPELVDRNQLRFFGSLVRRRAETLLGADLVFDGPGRAEAVVTSYEAPLVELGWERVDQTLHGAGFEGLPFRTSSLLNRQKTAVIFLYGIDREDGGADLHVRYNVEHARDRIAMMDRGMPPDESMLPPLKPPPGVNFLVESTSDVGMWKSDARAQTEVAPMELETYFAKQLEEAGWGRMTGSADENFAWSSWLIPDSGKWRGFLVVLAALPGWRYVTVRAEEILPGSH